MKTVTLPGASMLYPLKNFSNYKIFEWLQPFFDGNNYSLHTDVEGLRSRLTNPQKKAESHLTSMNGKADPLRALLSTRQVRHDRRVAYHALNFWKSIGSERSDSPVKVFQDAQVLVPPGVLRDRLQAQNSELIASQITTLSDVLSTPEE